MSLNRLYRKLFLSPASTKSDALIVFIHIPKTSGTALCHFLKSHFHHRQRLGWYGKEKCQSGLSNLASQIGDDTRLVYGHFDFGLDQLVDRQVNYFTILRHPVDRLISLYEFTRSKTASERDTPEFVRYAQQHGLLEFIDRYKRVCNGQTRIMSGNSGDLEQAKENLSHCVYGVQDHTDTFALMVARKLQLPATRLPIKNKTEYRGEYGPSLRQQIADRCEKDLKLYAFAKANFLSRVESELPGHLQTRAESTRSR